MKEIILILILLCSCTADDSVHFSRNFSPVNAYVKEVIDGDTYVVDINGSEKHVRVLGIDYPDISDDRIDNFIDLSVKKSRIKSCYDNGKKELVKILVGKNVTLNADKLAPDRDVYNRLLRYVNINGTDIGLLLLNNGYARFLNDNEIQCSRCIKYLESYNKVKDSKTGCLWDN
ncbi:MAG: thermonuclease family protein [Nanoarchaeota archaeon]